MALLTKKTKAKKAELEAKAAAAEARRAAQDSVTAMRDLAQALSAQLKDLGLDERAGEAVERLRTSEGYHKAQAKAGELGKRVTDTDAVTAGRETATREATKALAGLGLWLASGNRGKQLGIAPTKRRRSSGWVFALLGVGIGYGIGILTAPKRGSEVREQIVRRGETAGTVADHLQERTADGAPPFQRPLADKVRTRLGEDPRTAELSSLNINVVDGTVVVRGGALDDADQAAVRDVISDVEGVDEVELQLGSSA